jgi:hypothetical protein
MTEVGRLRGERRDEARVLLAEAHALAERFGATPVLERSVAAEAAVG